MRVKLFDFQEKAVDALRDKLDIASDSYRNHKHATSIISFTAPTGAGKTIIMASLIEGVYSGYKNYPAQKEAIFVWLSDSPQLNEQSRLKIEAKANRIRIGQCVTIEEASFDQETLDNGRIYFLNTQKLGIGSNLTKKGDKRSYTIWETMANTIRKKGDRLYFIIDEAHRGAAVSSDDGKRQTTIMQKFLLGSEKDGMPCPMPIVIGMSATIERFNALAESCESTHHYCKVSADSVRKSGLIKNSIIVKYSGEGKTTGEMTVLQEATANWMKKRESWNRYCKDYNHKEVNPILVIQVANARGGNITGTDLDACIENIEAKSGIKFETGEIVHAFGEKTTVTLKSGLKILYKEPSSISDDDNVKVVFFKQGLSTGWDCPRAETMMSFIRAEDFTYIAQLLGRMIRTPLHMHIQSDDTLNNVYLFLPYYNQDAVKKIQNELSKNGGELAVDVSYEALNEKIYDLMTCYPGRPYKEAIEQGSMNFGISNADKSNDDLAYHNELDEEKDACIETEQDATNISNTGNYNEASGKHMPITESSAPSSDESGLGEDERVINREEIVEFINEAAIPTYRLNGNRVNDPLTSLNKLATMLMVYGIYKDAVKDVRNDIVQKISIYISNLKASGVYENKTSNVRLLALQEQVFGVYGEQEEQMDANDFLDMHTITSMDIDSRFNDACRTIKIEGVGEEYGRDLSAIDPEMFEINPEAYKIDVILFSEDSRCKVDLDTYAEGKFHKYIDLYSVGVARKNSDTLNDVFNTISACGGTESRHNLSLKKEFYQTPNREQGEECGDHLFVRKDTGKASYRLNSWETETLEEARKDNDFVCWIRNLKNNSKDEDGSVGSLAIVYEDNHGAKRLLYPDFLIVRKGNSDSKYIVDIMEPHGDKFVDGVSKAKGLAKYARDNRGNGAIGKIQLIRENGKGNLLRLDMKKSEIQDKVLQTTTPAELDNLFLDFRGQ